MIIRFVKNSDREQVFILLDELISEAVRAGNLTMPVVDTIIRNKFFDEVIKRNDIKVFVAEEDGKLLGLADLFILPIMRRGYYQGHIEDFIVSEGVRGKGIGTKLFDAIKDYCKENDIKVIKLTSSLELQKAHEFYEKNGGEFTEKLFRFEL